MEALVGTVSEQVGLHGVRHVVLDVAHLVVRGQEVVHGHFGAHHDPARRSEVFVVRGRVAQPAAARSLPAATAGQSVLQSSGMPLALAKPRQAHPNMGCSSSCKSKAWRGTRQNAFSNLEIVPGVRENCRFVRSSCSPKLGDKLGDKLTLCVGVGTHHQS